jgi:hypothetical protein
VLVTGPWLAGVSGVVAALRDRLPEHAFVESTDLLAGEAPTAVVFVVSAAAALTESDCALLDAATADTDVVIGVVSKIDVHRNWRIVLTADRGRPARTRRSACRRPNRRSPRTACRSGGSTTEQVAGVGIPIADSRREVRPGR